MSYGGGGAARGVQQTERLARGGAGVGAGGVGVQNVVYKSLALSPVGCTRQTCPYFCVCSPC